MRTRPRTFTHLAVTAAAAAVLATAACGESGSSGTGGNAQASGSAGGSGGDACAPVPGDQLVVLEDDQQLQNADNIIPAVNAQAAAANPALVETLNAVSAELTTEQLIEMNAAVDVERQSAEDVAAAYVADNGLDSGSGGSGAVVVGAADFTESQVLANVYADALTAAGFQASVQTVGNRELYLPALQRGEIQAFPEYLATVADILNEQVTPGADPIASGDAEATAAALEPIAEQAGLVFGEPAEAADQNAFAVTTEFADALGVSTLSELAEACGDGSLLLGGPGECPTRPQCQPGLEDTYGLEFAGFSEYDAGGPLTKAAIQQGEVSIGLVFSSDGALAQG
ncbi:glycine betaine ABC transporter substrate-binding protein [Modestobacter roseus]|uniref:Osmoprotectant transport system substrate-binding protein n=1 Tax=Modestobacter roseus TaxID=1181884 RepID=A0A562IXJ2_9ACTN|nr:glycine betaine ABC transporter substrate-binding protein [Modestobacter roseus]MQA34767.1 glycine/betaine ABC transporter substrate-binding protein [Modestobacter roseus]TWH75602.1 osmoprotectant transport system substrate-binding protein [Modestobacter roseus]